MNQLGTALVGGAELRLDELVVAEENAPAVAVGPLQIAVAVTDVKRHGVVRRQEKQRQFGIVALLRTAAVDRHDEDMLGSRGLVHIVDGAQVGIEIVRVPIITNDLSRPISGAVVHDLRFAAHLRIAVNVVLLRRGDGQVSLGHQRLRRHLVRASENLVDFKQVVRPGQVAEDQVVKLVEARRHRRRRLRQFRHHLRLHRDDTERAHQVEIVPRTQEIGFAQNTAAGRLAQRRTVLNMVDHRIGAVDRNVAVFEIVFQLLGLAARDPVLKLVDIAGLVALGRHGLGRNVADVEDAARIFEERQGIISIEQPRLGIGLILVKIVVGIESGRLLLQVARREQPAERNDIKQIFHSRQLRISDPDRWYISAGGDNRPNRYHRPPPRDRNRRIR